MDILSHALWPPAIFQKASWKWKATLFGALPDVGNLFPLVYLFIQDGFRQIKWIIPFSDRTGIPYLTWTIPHEWMAPYFLLHSFVVWVAVVGVVWIFHKKMYWPLIGWGLHILFDMFLHSGRYATRIFYPISNWSIDSSIVWQDGIVLALNWGALLILYFIFIFRYIKKRQNKFKAPTT